MNTLMFINTCLLIAAIELGAGVPAPPNDFNAITPQSGYEIAHLITQNIYLTRKSEKLQLYLDKYIDGTAKAVKASGIKKFPPNMENWDIQVYLVTELKRHK